MKFLLSFVFSFCLFASTNNIERLKDDLNEKSFRVTKLAASIKSLDKSIGKKHKKYISKTEELNKVERLVEELQVELNRSADNVASDYELTNKIFRQYLLDRIDEKEENKILKDKIYIKTLSYQLEELSIAESRSKKLLSQVNDLSNKLSEIRKDEQTLYEIITTLENDKKSKSEEYINQLESKNSLREKLEKALAIKRVKRKKKKRTVKYKIARFKKSDLKLPLDSFSSFKGGAKGVTFTFDSVSPVMASSSGHVAYSGELASYGKIIMIDHGNDIRSLVLGDIKINVKKGDYVNKGQVVAYTISEPGIKKNLYYELRKKNIAQNTLKILKDNKIL